MKREIIEINEDKCTGCGECIPNCPEGALQVIDGKARLVSDLFCDGLGACVGHCPEDAMSVVTREAEEYDERKVMKNIVKQGPNTIKAHLCHLKDHGAQAYFDEAVQYLKDNDVSVPDTESQGCPGARVREMKPAASGKDTPSTLSQWPVQLNLLPIQAPFFSGKELLVAADCTAYAMGGFHGKLLAGKTLAIGCPKFDNIEGYKEKLTEIIKLNDIKSVTVAIMEVPCCNGLHTITEQALRDSGKNIPFNSVIVRIDGSVDE